MQAMKLLMLAAWVTPCVAAQTTIEEGDAAPVERIVITGSRYLKSDTISATKMNIPALETAQSIVTVTRGQMDDQNSQTVSEALRYSSGVLSDVEASSRNDSVFLRGFGGFGTDTVVVSFLDGMKLPRGQAYALFSIDPFLLENIEIVKGPSAVLYGQLNPGGLVNQELRGPTVESRHELRLEAGTHDRFQLGYASSGSLNDDGSWLYSFAGLGRDANTRYDGVEEKRVAAAPSLRWEPDENTSLTIKAFYIKDPDGGIFNSTLARSVAPKRYRGALDDWLNTGDPDKEYFHRKQYGISYQLSHQFSDNVLFYSSARFVRVTSDFLGMQLTSVVDDDGMLPRAAVRSDESVDGFETDNRLQLDLTTGALKHRVLLGVDYQESEADWLYSFAGAAPLDVLNPVYDQPLGAFMTLYDNRQRQQQTGVYLQDQISLGALRLMAGIRHDRAKMRTRDHLAAATSRQSDNETSYRAGAVYLFESGFAPYVSYSTSFEPVTGVAEDGSAFRPTTAKQYEGGIKYQPADARFLATLSAFDIKQDNVLSPGSTINFSVQDGQITSRGVEFEVRGHLQDNLQLIAAATWLDTKISKNSNDALIDKHPQAVPNKFASAWASYYFPSGWLRGFQLGGGVRYVAKSYGDDLNTLVAPSYTVADLALKYNLGEQLPALGDTELTFNVSNLFDKEYYTSCSYDIYCQFGNSRQALLGVRHSW